MDDLEVVKEFRRWIQGGQMASAIANLSTAMESLRANVVPLNRELTELNHNAKKSANLLDQIATLQRGVETQTNVLIILSVIMVIFGALQLYLVWSKG